VPLLAPSGIGVSSKRISAIMHWCGALMIAPLRDWVPVHGPSHCAWAVGGVAMRNVLDGWLLSIQQPK